MLEQKGRSAEYLTPKELSELLKISLHTVYKWTHFEYVPHVKLGKMLRFERGQIERWVNRRSRKGRGSYRLEKSEESQLCI